MPMKGSYLDMDVVLDDLDMPTQQFFSHCASGALHLQRCTSCGLMRYPTTTACPWCAHGEYDWKPVSGKGTLYSYGEIHHAIQPLFRQFSPYMLLLVELDEQRNLPQAHDGLRIVGNLVTADGTMAPPALVEQVGIGSRLKVVFCDLGGGLALPQWTLDADAQQPARPWRYPDARGAAR